MSYTPTASSATGYNLDSNARNIRPGVLDAVLRPLRVRAAEHLLRTSGIYTNLTTLAAYVRDGTLTREVYEAHSLPIRQFLDRDQFEQDNLAESSALLRGILTHAEFRRNFLDLPSETILLWTVANEHTDIGKLSYSPKVRHDHRRYVDGHNPMVDHPNIGALVLERAGFPSLPFGTYHPDPRHFDPSIVTAAARHHQEKFDGSGYPKRLAGRSIRLPIRAIKIVDSVVAMRMRKGRTIGQIVDELHRCKGADFDPGLVDIAVPVVLEYYTQSILRPFAGTAHPV